MPAPRRKASSAVCLSGELDETLILEEARTFDLETVTKLTCRAKGLARISRLDRCINLTELDLSGNGIHRIEGLDNLRKLKKLVLVNNRISSVENISKCPSLEHVLLQGNHIASLDSFLELPLLPNLKSIYLRNIDGTQQNPVCCAPDYRIQLLKLLPGLRNLDGERQPTTVGYLDNSPNTSDKENKHGPSVSGDGWKPSGWWLDKPGGGPGAWLADTKKFKALLAECRTLQISAKNELARAERSLPNSRPASAASRRREAGPGPSRS